MVTFDVILTIPNLPSTGTVRVTDNGRALRTLNFGGRTDTRRVQVTLPRGRHNLRAVYVTNATVAGSADSVVLGVN